MIKVASHIGTVKYVKKATQQSNLFRDSNFARAEKYSQSIATTTFRRWQYTGGYVNVSASGVDGNRAVTLQAPSSTSSISYIMQTLDVPLKSGEYYTISAWVKGSAANLLLYYINASGSTQSTTLSKATLGVSSWSDWTYIKYTFKTSSAYKAVGLGCPTSGASIMLYISKPKLERGTNDTGWTFHDGDYTIVPTPLGEWLAGSSSQNRYYYNGEPGSDEVSIVFRNGAFYACKVSHALSSSTFDTSLWDDGGNFKFIATSLFMAQRALIKNLAVGDVETSPTSGGAFIRMFGSLMQIYGSAGKMNIEFGVDGDGMAIMSYYDNNGNKLYDLGPQGIKQVETHDGSMTPVFLYRFGNSAPSAANINTFFFGSTTFPSQYRNGGDVTIQSSCYNTINRRYKYLSGKTVTGLYDETNNGKTFKTSSTSGSGSTLAPSSSNSVIDDGFYFVAPSTSAQCSKWHFEWDSTGYGTTNFAICKVFHYVGGLVTQTIKMSLF